MTLRQLAVLTLGLAACTPSPDAPKNDTGPLSGYYVAIQSEDAVDGRRPELNISCGEGDPFLMLRLIVAPATPPPPTGVFGSFKIDDAPPRRIELAWGQNDIWMIRDDAQEADLVRQLLAGRSLYFLGPEGTTERAYRWDMARLGDGIEELRRRC